MKELHKVVGERDEYVCQICTKDFSFPYYFQNNTNQYIIAHHTDSRGAHPETELETDVCISVCVECHTKIHKGLVKAPKHVPRELLEPSKSKPQLNGSINLRSDDKMCKCKKYLAQKIAGVCMTCERLGTADNFKKKIIKKTK